MLYGSTQKWWKPRINLKKTSPLWSSFLRCSVVRCVLKGRQASPTTLKHKKNISKSDDIPTKVIKEFGTFFAELLSKTFNSCLKSGSFTQDLKCAEVVSIYKKNDENDKSNYKPISLLSSISKVYERCMQKTTWRILQWFISKILVWFQARLCYSELSLGYDRKTEKN